MGQLFSCEDHDQETTGASPEAVLFEGATAEEDEAARSSAGATSTITEDAQNQNQQPQHANEEAPVPKPNSELPIQLEESPEEQKIESPERHVSRENSMRGGLAAVDEYLIPTQAAAAPAVTSVNSNNESSYAVLTLAAADQLHASWSNATQEDIMGLPSSVNSFGARAYESANLTVERPLAVSRLGPNQSRVSSIGDQQNGVSSAIHDAARITNWQSVKELCETNPEAARFVGRDRWTALHHACNRRCPYADVVEALIRAYPDALLLEEDKGWLPLHYACRFKAKKEVLRLLLHMYPERGETAVSKLDRQGRTPLYYAVRYDAPPGVVGLLLEVDASAVLEEDQNADSPLALVWDAWAEKLDGQRTLRRLYVPSSETGEMSLDERAKYVRKSLEGQVKLSERWNKVNIFLKAAFGFPVDDESEARDNIFEEKKDSPGSRSAAMERNWRVLHAAAAIKCHPSLFLLACALHPEQAFEFDEKELKGPPHVCGGCRSASHLTALHFAATSQANGESGKLVVNQLLSLNPGAAQAVDSEGSLPLHRISENKDKAHWAPDGAKDMYMAYTRAVQSPDMEGRLPLHRAAGAITHKEESNETTMERSAICNLIEVYADAACHADHCGRLPMHFVAQNATVWDVQVQTLHDAFPTAVRARTGVKLGNSLPLHMAASNPEAAFSLINHLVELHPRGASQSDRQGKLPLHLACENGMTWESVSSIHDAFPGAVRQAEHNSRGWTALHMAAASHKADNELLSNVVELCRESATMADSRGRYALHLACISGKSWGGGLSTLFDANPDALRCPDNVGLLPFHIASFRFSASSCDEIVKRPERIEEPKKRRHRRSISVEAMQLQVQSKTAVEDARRTEILFQLLKADPTVL